MDILSIARGLGGILFLVIIAFLFSRDRKNINWRLVIMGLGLQLLIGTLILNVEFVQDIFGKIADGFVWVVSFAPKASEFVFGNLAKAPDEAGGMGFFFAFRVLPVIVFFSALTSLLFYLGVLQLVVKGFAWVMSKTLGTSGAETISASANVFLGQTEAPLLVKPYIAGMTRSELLCLMIGGMATIAGSVMATYLSMLSSKIPDIGLHLLSASLMNAPAAIVIAKILLPEANPDLINKELAVSKEKIGSNIIEAIASGTSDGLRLAVNVGAMLIAFMAIIYMLDAALLELGGLLGVNESIKASTTTVSYDAAGAPVSYTAFDGLSFGYILGQLFRVIAFMLGVDWTDTLIVGSLLGKKLIINEFIAYNDLATMPVNALTYKSKVIISYALCGFANFGSIGIQIGGIGALAPNQTTNLSQLGLLAVLGGLISSMMSGCIAGMFVH